MRKTIKYILTVWLAAGMAVSCEYASFLDQYPYSQTSPENFYTTENSMYMALASCYEVINGHKIPGASYVQRGSYGQGMQYIMNSPSDDMVAATSSSDEGLEMTWGNYNESTRCVRDAWKVMYTGINRCNTVLHYIGNIDMSEDTRTKYIAEARFLRAFFYYHLAWNWGGVPIVTSFESDGTEERSSLEDVYSFILDDLDFAYRNLDESGILQTSSANRYTAAAYIARICNYLAACKVHGTGADLVKEQPLNDFSFVDEKEMWETARKACLDIIGHSSYRLIDDYTNLFRETTKAQQYQECLLLAEQALSGSEGYWPNSFYLPSPTNNSDSPTVYGGRFVPTCRAFYMYSSKDPRRDHNLTGRAQDGKTEIKVDGYTYYNPNPPRAMVPVPVPEGEEPVIDPATGKQMQMEHPLYDSGTQTYLPVSGMQLCAGKFRLCNYEEVQHSYQQHALSYPLMRLADVYLMYAEALYFGSDDEDGARIWMDKVLLRACRNDEALFNELKAYYRERAEKEAASSSLEPFVVELLESRERELIFEFSRKWDLIRFNIMFESIASLNEEMVAEKLPETMLDPADPDYIDPKFLTYQTGGYLILGIPTVKANMDENSRHKIWLPISEEQIGVNSGLKQNAGWE